MKEKPEDDIRNCTPERLAEMMDFYAADAEDSAEFSRQKGVVADTVNYFIFKAAVFREAARRLRNWPKVAFNYEQFE